MKSTTKWIHQTATLAIFGGLLVISPNQPAASAQDVRDANQQRDYFDADLEPVAANRPVITLRPPNQPNLSNEQDRKAYAKKLRVQRAQFEARQRMLRREQMLWSGQTPLRPAFNFLPMMTSVYQQPKIIVPVYVR